MNRIYKMPGIAVAFLLLGCVAISGCKKDRDARPETSHQVSNLSIDEFSDYFADKLAKNQLDSLWFFYPGLVKADSVSYRPTGLPPVIKELSKDTYEVKLSPTVRLIVKRDAEGKLTVAESFGLFAFNENDRALAVSTGLWNDSLPDLQMSDRMADKNFFEYIKSKGTVKVTDLVAVESPRFPYPDAPTGVQPIRNLTEYTIDGNDYTVTYHRETAHSSQAEGESGNFFVDGKTIAPGDTVGFEVVNSASNITMVTGVKFKLSQEELLAKYRPFTGKEYEEYLQLKAEK